MGNDINFRLLQLFALQKVKNLSNERNTLVINLLDRFEISNTVHVKQNLNSVDGVEQNLDRHYR